MTKIWTTHIKSL